MLQGLRTTIYHIPAEHYARAKDWYTLVAGVQPYFDQPFYVGFQIGGFELGLLPDGQTGPGGSVAYWGTADARAEVQRLLELGATLVDPVTDVGDGIQVAVVADPFGNLLGVIRNPHFDRSAVM